MPDRGTSVQKACRILGVLSDPRNGRLTDIAQAAGQDKATTLRLLESLEREGLVVRDASTKRYALGVEALVIGAAALARLDLRPLARPGLVRLVGAFEDTAILSVPRGSEAVCIDVEAGTFPIRASFLEVGSRRPLGAGAGSLALLAWLPDAEIAALAPAISARIAGHPRLSWTVIERHVEDSRRRGYALMLDLVVDRMGGIAMPVPGPDGRPIAALSVAALSERIASRERALAEALAREVAACAVPGSRAAGQAKAAR